MKNFIAASLVLTATLVGFVAAEIAQAAEEAARIENCVKITMRVKGCGEDGFSPCESSYCYDSYDFKIAESAGDDVGPAKRSKPHSKKSPRKRHSA